MMHSPHWHVNFFHPEIAQPAILTEGGNDKPVVAMDPETPTCGDIPVVASTHTDECDVEMSAEDAEANAWLGSVNDQPTRLSWEQSVSREEESVLLDEYPPAEKMACQSPVGEYQLMLEATRWVVRMMMKMTEVLRRWEK
ncbi:hypothetical protein EMCRGX_G000041 [Ephydatia muelleri]